MTLVLSRCRPKGGRRGYMSGESVNVIIYAIVTTKRLQRMGRAVKDD